MGAISIGARLWAIKQLARRAGVNRDLFQSWAIDVSRDTTTIRLETGTSKQIVFRNLSQKNGDNPAGSDFQTVRAQWMSEPEHRLRAEIPDLIVPFCERSGHGMPLFSRVQPDCIECFADLPASTLFTLCRAEEVPARDLDEHSRFSAGMSVAGRDGFLDRPVVDEWGLAFAQAIEALMPGWHAKPRPLRATVSHDIDEVGFKPGLWRIPRNGDLRTRTGWMVLPFDLRYAIKQSVVHRDPRRGATQLARALTSEPSCLELVKIVVGAAQRRGLESAVYWKASRVGPFDSGYDPRDHRVRNMIEWLQTQGIENGVHPGYRTFRCPQELQHEVQILRSVLGEERLGGRQHYLRWCPQSWIDWENCGLAYDGSVGYADQAGFRAGTCIPYRPWLLSLDREARLLEIPLVVMDATLLDSMRLRGDELLNVVSQLVDRCRAVGGVFTFLCHNTALRDDRFAGHYEQILELLAATERFDWQTSLDNEWA